MDSASIGTWVTGEVVSASQMNTHVRDNLLVTAPAVATSSGGFIVTDAANSVVQRTPSPANVDTSQTTTSTSYTDLATAGPAVTVTTGTRAYVTVTALMSNSGAGNQCFMGTTVSGASAISAADGLALVYESGAANDRMRASFSAIFAGLTGGSNTFTAKYRVDAGTGTFVNRRIEVIPF